MEDILWSMTQESRVLQDIRKDIRGVWQDEAARELNSRYLNPHESDDEQMLAGLNQQKSALDEATVKLVSAEGYARRAGEYAILVADGLEATQQELHTTYGNYDTYAHYNSEARSKFPTIQELISRADNVFTE